MSEKIQALKDRLPAALELWDRSNGQTTTVGWLKDANPAAVGELLSALAHAEHKAAVDHEAACALNAELQSAQKRIAELEQGQQQPAGYIDARCFDGKYPTGGSWSLRPHDIGGLNQLTPFYLAPPRQNPIGYVDMFAVMGMQEGKSRFCSLRPEPKGIGYVEIYAGASVAVPKQQPSEGKN